MPFLHGKVNSAHYIAQVVNPVLLPFLRQEGDVFFQLDNAHPHTAAMMQHALRGVQQLPWPARTPDLSPIKYVWDMIKRVQPLLNCVNGCNMHSIMTLIIFPSATDCETDVTDLGQMAYQARNP